MQAALALALSLLCTTLSAATSTPLFVQARGEQCVACTTLAISITTQSGANSGLIISWEAQASAMTSIAFGGSNATILSDNPLSGGATYGQSIAYLTSIPANYLGNVTFTAAGAGALRAVVTEYSGLAAVPTTNFTYRYDASGGNVSTTLTTQAENSMVHLGVFWTPGWDGSTLVTGATWTKRYSVVALMGETTWTSAAAHAGTVNAYCSNSGGGTQYIGIIMAELLCAPDTTSNQIVPSTPNQWQRRKPFITPQRPWSFFLKLLLGERELQAGIIDWQYEQANARLFASRDAAVRKSRLTATPSPTPVRGTPSPTVTPTPPKGA